MCGNLYALGLATNCSGFELLMLTQSHRFLWRMVSEGAFESALKDHTQFIDQVC